MPDRLLILHWNELSFPEEITAEQMLDDPRWRERALAAMSALRKAARLRPESRISFSKGVFHGQVGGRPFMSWLEIWLGADGFRYLRGRTIQPNATPEPMHQMECEVSCHGRIGEGVTRAHVAESWTWSFGCVGMGFEEAKIPGQKTTIDQDGDTPVEVSNLAVEEHVEHWSRNLSDYGCSISDNHVIAELARYTIIMYPLDHGYPHIHVHARDDGSLNAKFRIDVFEPLTNGHPAGLDAIVATWIAERRDGLLHSWQRCQEGRFPLKL